MKYYTFYRESNDFSDILDDTNLQKVVKLSWQNYLMIGLSHDTPESVVGYIVLKYGDDIKDPMYRDFSPIMNVDYVPK